MAGSRKANILIIDDEPGVVETLADIFKEKGYAVDTASSGEEGIDKCSKGMYDILFIDMRMPKLNGRETHAKIKRTNPGLTTIIITAYRQEMKDEINKALKSDAHSCLYKPFAPEKAVNLVEKIMRKKAKKPAQGRGRPA